MPKAIICRVVPATDNLPVRYVIDAEQQVQRGFSEPCNNFSRIENIKHLMQEYARNLGWKNYVGFGELPDGDYVLTQCQPFVN